MNKMPMLAARRDATTESKGAGNNRKAFAKVTMTECKIKREIDVLWRWRSIIHTLLAVLLVCRPTDAFTSMSTTCRKHRGYRSKLPLHAIAETNAVFVLADYAPNAADLFSNMKLPAAVVTAGMISLGFATRFPELPPDSLEKV